MVYVQVHIDRSTKTMGWWGGDGIKSQKHRFYNKRPSLAILKSKHVLDFSTPVVFFSFHLNS
jgi:hypothetical protein